MTRTRRGNPGTPPTPDGRMSAPASLLGHWHALGPEGVPFVPGDPDFNVHRIVEDDPTLPNVTVENDGGQRFVLGRAFARAIAISPIRFQLEPP